MSKNISIETKEQRREQNREQKKLTRQYKMKTSGNKILITGGASGIGLGLVRRFVAEGNAVLICGRRADALQKVVEELPTVVTRVCDLAREEDRASLYRWVVEQHPDLNVLVNNAGIQNWMNPAETNDEEFYRRAKEEINTNVEAPLHLISLFLKGELQSFDTIVNVTSGLAFVPFAKVPVYSATKACLHSFTQSLRYLLQSRSASDNGNTKKPVEVVELIPPALNTDLGGKGLHDFAPPVSDFIEAVFEQLKQGKTEITFGFSETLSQGVSNLVKPQFDRLNPPPQPSSSSSS